MHSRTTWSWAAVAGLTLVVACKLAPHLTGPNSGQLAQIVVSPDSVALDPQQTQQFQAFGRTAAGDSVGATVTWSASAGTITASGMYTADTSAADVVVTASVSADQLDRKSTRLNSSHLVISYAVFCLKKKKKTRMLRKMKKANAASPMHNDKTHLAAYDDRAMGASPD